MAEDPKRRSFWGDTERSRKTPAKGVPVPNEFADEPATDVLEGAALDEVRSRRPTPIRLRHIEQRLDGQSKDHRALAGTVSETREIVIRVDAKQDAQTKQLDTLHDSLSRVLDDAADVTKNRRKLITAALVGGGGMLVEILHRIFA